MLLTQLITEGVCKLVIARTLGLSPLADEIEHLRFVNLRLPIAVSLDPSPAVLTLEVDTVGPPELPPIVDGDAETLKLFEEQVCLTEAPLKLGEASCGE